MAIQPIKRNGKTMIRRLLMVLVFILANSILAAAPIELTLRRLAEAEPGQNQWKTIETRVAWNSSDTCAVVCDMWDKHWCKGATARVQEMAPRMSQFISSLRDRGVLIIHCPSETMKFYEGTPGRKLAQSAPQAVATPPITGWSSRDPKREPPLPIDDSDGGCDDTPPCPVSSPWTRQISSLEIKDGDAITDSVEAFNLGALITKTAGALVTLLATTA